MTTYIVTYKIFGKAFRTKVPATSAKDAENKVWQGFKIIEVKAEDEGLDHIKKMLHID